MRIGNGTGKVIAFIPVAKFPSFFWPNGVSYLGNGIRMKRQLKNRLPTHELCREKASMDHSIRFYGQVAKCGVFLSFHSRIRHVDFLLFFVSAQKKRISTLLFLQPTLMTIVDTTMERVWDKYKYGLHWVRIELQEVVRGRGAKMAAAECNLGTATFHSFCFGLHDCQERK
jgi:hypothetical protein